MTTVLRPTVAAPARTADAMSTCFTITPRTHDQPVPAQDAARVGAMRRLARARLRYCGLEEMAEDVEVIVSELVTNAILHSGGSQVTFTMAVQDGLLRLCLDDGVPGTPNAGHASDTAETGRGLWLVESLVAARGGTWGTSDDGAATRCRIPLQPPAPTRSDGGDRR